MPASRLDSFPDCQSLLAGVFAFLDATLHPDEIEEAKGLEPELRPQASSPCVRGRIAAHLRHHFRFMARSSTIRRELAPHRLYSERDMSDALTAAYALHCRGEVPEAALHADYCLDLEGPLKWVEIEPLQAAARGEDLESRLDANVAAWKCLSYLYESGDRLLEYSNPGCINLVLVRGDRLVAMEETRRFLTCGPHHCHDAEVAHFRDLGGTRGFLKGEFEWPDPGWINPVTDHDHQKVGGDRENRPESFRPTDSPERPIGPSIPGVFAFLSAVVGEDLAGDLESTDPEAQPDWFRHPVLWDLRKLINDTFRLQFHGCPLRAELASFRLFFRDDMADALLSAYRARQRGGSVEEALSADYSIGRRHSWGLLEWVDLDVMERTADERPVTTGYAWGQFRRFAKKGDRGVKYSKNSSQGYLLLRGDRLVWPCETVHYCVLGLSLELEAAEREFVRRGGANAFLRGDFVWPDHNWENPAPKGDHSDFKGEITGS